MIRKSILASTQGLLSRFYNQPNSLQYWLSYDLIYSSSFLTLQPYENPSSPLWTSSSHLSQSTSSSNQFFTLSNSACTQSTNDSWVWLIIEDTCIHLCTWSVHFNLFIYIYIYIYIHPKSRSLNMFFISILYIFLQISSICVGPKIPYTGRKFMPRQGLIQHGIP